MGLLSMLADFGSIKSKAPGMLAGFLDTLLDQNRPLLKPEDGEVQICYLMSQEEKGNPSQYIIAIVALSADDRVLRVLKAIPLSDAISTILNNMPNA